MLISVPYGLFLLLELLLFV